MDLRTQQNDGLKMQSPGRRSFLGALFALSTAAVTALLAAPSGALRNLSDAQERNCHCLVRPGAGAGLCFHHRADCKDDYAGTP